jgi:hypothetical protein
VAAAGHGVAGIDGQVYYDLFHLASVDSNRQEAGIQDRANQDILANETPEHDFHFAHYRVEIYETRLDDLLAAEGEQLTG